MVPGRHGLPKVVHLSAFHEGGEASAPYSSIG